MTSAQFTRLIKDQAKLHGIAGPDLEAAVGHVLTESVRETAYKRENSGEALCDYLFVIATILKCWGLPVRVLENPRTLKALRLMTEMLERTTPIEDEFIQ